MDHLRSRGDLLHVGHPVPEALVNQNTAAGVAVASRDLDVLPVEVPGRALRKDEPGLVLAHLDLDSLRDAVYGLAHVRNEDTHRIGRRLRLREKGAQTLDHPTDLHPWPPCGVEW